MATMTKRERRTSTDMDVIRKAIIEALKEDHPMTVRQVFYRLVSAGVIGKTEAEYKTTVTRLLGQMRRDGSVPFGWIADNTRWMRKPRTYGSLEQMLRLTTETYRRAVWGNQDAYVEIWLEKDALAGVILDVTQQWDVPLMVTRGYPSITFLQEAAMTIKEVRKPTFLYYLGDRDPSGLDIPRAVQDGIREFAPGTPFNFERIAVTDEQIASMGLMTRPTKKTDSRSKGFDGESVEVDAIPPKRLKALVDGCITQHIDDLKYWALQDGEAAEKDTIRAVIERTNWKYETDQVIEKQKEQNRQRDEHEERQRHEEWLREQGRTE